MRAILQAVGGLTTEVERIDRVSFVNHESYGTPAAQEAIEDDGCEVLIVNVNSFVSLRLGPD